MSAPDLDETLHFDFVSAVGALVVRQLNKLDEDVRLHVADAVNSGQWRMELRVRLEDGCTEIVLVPARGGEAVNVARTSLLLH